MIYNYQVLSYPKYDGIKKLKKTNYSGNIACGNNKLISTFTPVEQQAMSKVQLSLGSVTGSLALDSKITINASGSDTKVVKDVSLDGNYQLSESDFGFANGQIPAGTTFTVIQNVTITGPNGSTLDLAPDSLSVVLDYGQLQELAKTPEKSYTIEDPDLALKVPKSLSFETQLLHKERTIYSDCKDSVELTNNYSSAQHVTLSAREDGDDLKNLLFYQKGSDSLPLSNEESIFDGDSKDGLVLHVPKDDMGLKRNMTGTITWTATNSLFMRGSKIMNGKELTVRTMGTFMGLVCGVVLSQQVIHADTTEQENADANTALVKTAPDTEQSAAENNSDNNVSSDQQTATTDSVNSDVSNTTTAPAEASTDTSVNSDDNANVVSNDETNTNTTNSDMTGTTTTNVDNTVTDSDAAPATNAPLAQGTWGTSKWDYTQDGDDYVLTFHAGTLGSGGISGSDEFKDIPGGSYNKEITKIILDQDVVANEDSSSLFADLENLKEIVGLQNLDTSKVTNMESMFREC
ncbi:hypothetical protein MOO45_03085 [Bombilactobacillus folatiphilus]|uniref:Uncharacterized protein n=1 Tax=Bombilactobacillus folatiphilus TaxID=2923362 RepID=A0ABY4PAR2_9LACO|nr:hypothetical protein [Bombilactobacillus folatiphilus]UQS82644.1 hypothetical protein MOO45_03085 [Bombilactobacillus folatiphilus]